MGFVLDSELAALRRDQERFHALLRLWSVVTREHQADTIARIDDLARHDDGILAYAAEVTQRKEDRAKRRRGRLAPLQAGPAAGALTRLSRVMHVIKIITRHAPMHFFS